MRIDVVREYLLPGAAEQDPAFRADLRKLSHLGLMIVGGLQFGVPILMAAAGLGVIPQPASQSHALIPNIAVSTIGALTLLVGWTPWSRQHGRAATAVSVWLSSAVLEWSVLLFQPDMTWIEHYLIGHITLVKFGAAALPFKPLQMLSLGIAIDLWYLISWLLAQSWGWTHGGFGAGQHIFPVLITFACTFLTSLIYRQRATNFQTHQRALRAAEELRRAESRLLISENAADMGRLAAALSHELNSPIGVLASAVDTLALVARRSTQGNGGDSRISRVVEDTFHAGKVSADRLRAIVARMQRFTNLDRADVQSVDLNELIRDVVVLLEPEAQGRATIDLSLDPVPRFLGRPQQLSAVLSNLIGNAIQALGDSGTVRVSSRYHDSHIRIEVADTGRGMQPEELANVFNPASFRVSGGRVAAGNWSLFSSRQIVQEHGGDIDVQSKPGEGTVVRIEFRHEPTTAVPPGITA